MKILLESFLLELSCTQGTGGQRSRQRSSSPDEVVLVVVGPDYMHAAGVDQGWDATLHAGVEDVLGSCGRRELLFKEVEDVRARRMEIWLKRRRSHVKSIKSSICGRYVFHFFGIKIRLPSPECEFKEAQSATCVWYVGGA